MRPLTLLALSGLARPFLLPTKRSARSFAARIAYRAFLVARHCCSDRSTASHLLRSFQLPLPPSFNSQTSVAAMPSFFSRFKRQQAVQLPDDEKAAAFEQDATRFTPPSSPTTGKRGLGNRRQRTIGNYAPHPAILRTLRFLM
jgi:hypothetical protein